MLKQILESESENSLAKYYGLYNLFIADDYKPSQTSEYKYASFLISTIVV